MDYFTFPGDPIPQSLLPIPRTPSASLKLGPGLSHVPPATIVPTVAGTLQSDKRKATAWVENDGGRYIPQPGHLVIATVIRSLADSYLCSLTPHTPPAHLPHMAFANVTKKTRPQLAVGALVYARVVSPISSSSSSSSSLNAGVLRYLEPQLVCYEPATGKSEGLGELKPAGAPPAVPGSGAAPAPAGAGMSFPVSLAFARRLFLGRASRGLGGIEVLDFLSERVAFEVCVGRNGRVWVDGGGIKHTAVVGKALVETDARRLSVADQRKLVDRLFRSL